MNTELLVSDLTVEDWRFEQLVGAAWCEQQALVLAVSREAGLQLACNLLAEGCHPNSALQILL